MLIPGCKCLNDQPFLRLQDKGELDMRPRLHMPIWHSHYELAYQPDGSVFSKRWGTWLGWAELGLGWACDPPVLQVMSPS